MYGRDPCLVIQELWGWKYRVRGLPSYIRDLYFKSRHGPLSVRKPTDLLRANWSVPVNLLSAMGFVPVYFKPADFPTHNRHDASMKRNLVERVMGRRRADTGKLVLCFRQQLVIVTSGWTEPPLRVLMRNVVPKERHRPNLQ